MAKSLKAGITFGRWTLLGDHLDKGGNSYIWRVENASGEGAVIKLLQQHLLQQVHQSHGAKKVERFMREIRFYREHGDQSGILPLLDSHVPEQPSTEDPPWLVTKLAVPAHKAFSPGNREFVAVISFIARVAKTLATLHEKEIFHRDVKPHNLFLLDQEPLVGDFGLVEIPDLEPITEEGELVGPLFYAAPEMISDGARSRGGPADVYSLAKTLWVLASGQTFPLPGEQRTDVPALTLSAYVNHEKATLLDSVIERATSVNPEARPTMAEFARNLEEWLREPVKAVSPGDLSHLKSKLAAALESGRRAKLVQAECETLLRVTLGRFENRVRNVRESLAQVVPVTGVAANRTVFDEISKHSSHYMDHAENSILGAVCAVLTNPGSLGNQYELTVPEVHLWAGGGVAVAYDTKAIYLAAGFFVGFNVYRQPVWQDDRTCIYGTSDFENAIQELANGLIENQEKALLAFADLCATVRFRPSGPPAAQ